MSGLSDFINEQKDYNKVNGIQDLNYQYSYEDKKGLGGSLECALLSCGQYRSRDEYNELKRF